MRRAVAAIVVTVVAVVLVAGFDARPPRTYNPESALRAAAVRPPPPRRDPDARVGRGPITVTPFSAIQVEATLTRGRLTGVRTLVLTGDGAHTQRLNARAEPVLRVEALRAASADVDIVSGATNTSESWIESLEAAIEDARDG